MAKKMTEKDVGKLQELIEERASIQKNILRLSEDGVKLCFDELDSARRIGINWYGYMSVVHHDKAMENDIKDFARSAMRKRQAQITEELAKHGVE